MEGNREKKHAVELTVRKKQEKNLNAGTYENEA